MDWQINKKMNTIIYTLDSTRKFGSLLNSIISNVKMMHWYTNDYNMHLIFGNLYDNLNDLFDKFQEEIIGLSKCSKEQFPEFQLNNFDNNQYTNDEAIMDSYVALEIFLKQILTSFELDSYIKNVTSGLNNTKEEIISTLNKTNYLLSMIKI